MSIVSTWRTQWTKNRQQGHFIIRPLSAMSEKYKGSEEVKTETGKQYFATLEESAGLIISNRRVQASGSES